SVFLWHDARMHQYVTAILTEAWHGVTPEPPAYRAAREVAARQRVFRPAGRRAAARLCRRWHVEDVTTGLLVAIWIARRLLALHAYRHGQVASPHAAPFLGSARAEGSHAADVRGLRTTLRRGERGY